MSDITNAMLARLTIHRWGGRKRARGAEDAVDEMFKATLSGTFTKDLIGRDELTEIGTLASEARALFNRFTLPWQDRGSRILPTAKYMDLSAEISRIISRFNQAVNKFAEGYAEAVERRSQELGLLYQEEDYPSPDDIVQRFGIDVSFAPIPTGNDFRCELDGNEEAVAQRITENSQAALEEATNSLITRLLESAQHLADGLDRIDDGGRMKRAVLDNMISAAQLARELNFSGRKAVNDLADKIEACAKQYEIEDLRADDAMREQKRKDVQDILDLFS